jgi:RHS repeat-associated protein
MSFIERADGTLMEYGTSPDPRFKDSADYVSSYRITLPSDAPADPADIPTHNYTPTQTVTVSRDIALEDENDVGTMTSFTETTTTNGAVFSKTYDVALQQWTYTSAEGRESFADIDNLGRVTQAWSNGLEPVAIVYDPYDRIEAVQTGTAGNLRTYQFTYDENGFLDSVTDPLSRVTSYLNDEAGRALTKVLPDGREIGFTYDANGNVQSITPPGRPSHEFGYTPVDLLEDYDPPDIAGVTPDVTHYDYNADRQVELITRPDGQTIDYVYDSAGRLSSIELPGAEQISITYNATTGKIETMSSPDGETLTYTFDGPLPLSAAMTGLVAGTVSQSYNDDFQVETRDVNGANAVAFTYDNDGLPESAGDLDLILDPVTGLLDGTTMGTVATNNTYTTFGELETESYSVSGTPVYDVSYVRDDLGRITNRTEMIDGVATQYEYEYDLAGRLTDVYLNGDVNPVSHYDYDANGNRISFQDYRSGGAVVQNGVYDDQDRMTLYGNATDGYADYVYTANGELLSKTLNGETTTYDYDVLGNLRGVTLPDGMEIDYIVDAVGRKVGKKVDGVLEMGLLYKDALNPIAELDENGNVVSRFVYGSKFNVPDYFTSNKEDGSTWKTYRIVSNHLGSPRMVVDTATGSVVQRMDYDEFGRVLEDTNIGFQPFGFAGGVYDSDTGLVRFGVRDYSAEEGRWLSKDPIGFRGGDSNLYGYVLANPINSVDLLGMQYCGPGEGMGETIVPDTFSDIFGDELYDFTDVCKQHDEDYATPGMPKWRADLNLFLNAIKLGYETDNLMNSCIFGWLYYIAVSYGGDSAYKQAQEAASKSLAPTVEPQAPDPEPPRPPTIFTDDNY